MSHPRGLSAGEAAAWEALAKSVTPLVRRTPASAARAQAASPPAVPAPPAPLPPTFAPKAAPVQRAKPARPAPAPPPVRPLARSQLDSHWERRLKGGDIRPDVSLDLHGHGLDAAYRRLMDGMTQARAMEARVVLVVTGKARPVDPPDRGERRGAIRAKILDWLAASEHATRIAAVRKAHRRHGGEGALYLVLRRGG
ncbi:Smr/MutS family protein [Erythrobacter sp. LQ02-29]|uniref:Smr/MutS family protein n=1 Tax=Erythrobacter sp. LQ02-29 TaxID=2920384 RepID=UPI001F4E54DE|nr:Smr/MutS family protein [Erythrobacter sp. LQ02-29]MCP9221651.1 Smr/MutS family protein [Erythrobacter sp. LQ02-29]